jgi:Ca2+/H+ antiporter
MSSATEHALPELHRTAFSEFLRSPINWLFVFIPITVVLEHLGHVSAPVVFFMAAVAIIPIAALIVPCD